MSTMTTAAIGTATTTPKIPNSFATISTAIMLITGGISTRLAVIRGSTKFPSMMCTTTPSTTTSRKCPPGPSPHTPSPPSTNSAGSSVPTSVPKKGTTTTAPTKIPNVSQYGTCSTYRPNAVSSASTVMASSWAPIHARSVLPMSSITSRTVSRCTGGKSAMSHSRYTPGYSAM